MDLEKLNEELQNKELSKDSILRLINLKTDSDMEKAITRFEAAVNSLKAETNANIGSLKSETSFIKWLIGGIFAAITILLAIVSLKK